MTASIEQFKEIVARRLKLSPEVLYGKPLRLSEVVAKSPVASNSIDLVEAVAGALAEMGVDEDIDLPALTLDHTVNDLLTKVEEGFKQLNGASAA